MRFFGGSGVDLPAVAMNSAAPKERKHHLGPCSPGGDELIELTSFAASARDSAGVEPDEETAGKSRKSWRNLRKFLLWLSCVGAWCCQTLVGWGGWCWLAVFWVELGLVLGKLRLGVTSHVLIMIYLHSFWMDCTVGFSPPTPILVETTCQADQVSLLSQKASQ